MLTDIQRFQALFDVVWEQAQALDASYGKDIVAKLRECIPAVERLATTKGATTTTAAWDTTRQQ